MSIENVRTAQSQNTECRAGAYGQYGTPLRPDFADQISLHILRTSQSALSLRERGEGLVQVAETGLAFGVDLISEAL